MFKTEGEIGKSIFGKRGVERESIDNSSSMILQEGEIHDFSLGKRSSSTDDQNGSAFISPRSEIQQGNKSSQRKNFFRQNVSPQAELINPSLEQISKLSSEQKIWVANMLKLDPPTPEHLFFVLQQSCTLNPQLVKTLTDTISQMMGSAPISPHITNVSSPTTPFYSPNQNQRSTNSRGFLLKKPKKDTLPPISSFEFNDFRYSHVKNEDVILKGPLIIGMQPIDTTVKIPDIAPNLHVIIQCYLAGVAPSPFKWPYSLEIRVNNKIIKGSGMYSFPVIDITPIMPQAIVQISCSPETCQYYLIIRPSKFRSFSQIVAEMQENVSTHQLEPPFDPTVSVLCPLTGEMLRHPGRGELCSHYHCFDLKQYIQRANISQRWVCPICSKPANFKSLYFSRSMKNYIYDISPSSSPVTTEFAQYDTTSPLEDNDDILQDNINMF